MQRHSLQLPLSEVRELRYRRIVRAPKAYNTCLPPTFFLSPSTDYSASTVDGPCALPAAVHSLIFTFFKPFCSFARRLCLRATPIFALCSDHCKKNNGNNEWNACVNPFWVEHDLNPYIKPYRQYRSAFLPPGTTPIVSEHPLPTVSKHLTPGVRQSPAPTISQEVENPITASVSLASPQPHRVAPSLASSDTSPRDPTTPIEIEAAESPNASPAEGVSSVNHT